MPYIDKSACRQSKLKVLRRTVPLLLALCSAIIVGPASAESGDVKVSWGGWVKLDVLASRFSEGEVAQGTSRDFYVPGTIPVSNGGGESFTSLDFHAKETRLFVKGETQLENGRNLGGYIEGDFLVNQGPGTEVVSNAYNPGLRRAFVTYGDWLLGQEWTTFNNLGSIPETLDFIAYPSDGTVLVRQPMVRVKVGPVYLALENPETTLNTAGATAAKNDSIVPDLVAKWQTALSEGGNVAVAVIGRQLRVDDTSGGGLDTDTFGYGVSGSGKIIVSNSDDIRFTMTWGSGIGRYVALATSADAVVDGQDIEAIDVAAGYIAYRHAWSDKLRSNATISAFQADNDIVLTGTGVTKRVVSGSINLLYSPVPKIMLGVEYRHAERKVESSADGSLDRLQFSAKYFLP